MVMFLEFSLMESCNWEWSILEGLTKDRADACVYFGLEQEERVGGCWMLDGRVARKGRRSGAERDGGVAEKGSG